MLNVFEIQETKMISLEYVRTGSQNTVMLQKCAWYKIMFFRYTLWKLLISNYNYSHTVNSISGLQIASNNCKVI